MNFTPLYDRVVIVPDEEVKVTAGGILLADSIQKPTKTGTVVAVGAGLYDQGHLIPLTVKVGNKVLFSAAQRNEIEVDGYKYLIMQEKEVIGIL